MPLGPQISTSVTLGGRVKPGGSTGWAASMMSRQIGPAPSMPLTSSMGVLSALPTQTPTMRSVV